MKIYNVTISVEVLADDKKDAIIEAKRTIYDMVIDKDFIISCDLQ